MFKKSPRKSFSNKNFPLNRFDSKLSYISHSKSIISRRKNKFFFKRKKSTTTITSKKKYENHHFNKNYLWIIFWVKKFADILKTATIINKTRRLNKYHFKLIQDKSHFKSYIPKNTAKVINNPFFNKMVKINFK